MVCGRCTTGDCSIQPTALRTNVSASPCGATKTDLAPLIDLVRRLRAPDGCPWDREQTLPNVRAYLLEEAHEVAAAIDGGDLSDVAGELGDLLFQVVFTAVLVGESGGVSATEIIESIHTKMVERHPHVFADEVLTTSEEVNRAWESSKALQNDPETSILDGVPHSLPALLASYRMTQKAAGVGFDWPNIDGVLAKVEEELSELRQALANAPELPSEVLDPGVSEELGDLLFAVANLGRHLDADPEGTLASANLKFRRRFAFIERQLVQQGRQLGTVGLADLDELWEQAKRDERS